MLHPEQYSFSIKWRAAFSDQTADFLALAAKYCREYDPLDDSDTGTFLADCENSPERDDSLQKALLDCDTPEQLLDVLYHRCERMQKQNAPLTDKEQERCRQNFLALLDRAVYLSSKNAVPFLGTPQKIKLVSQRQTFISPPEPWEESVQTLVIEQSGKVSFCGNALKWGSAARRREFTVTQSTSRMILQEVATCFSVLPDDDWVLDAGFWDLELTNTDGQSFYFSGPMWEGEGHENARLSEMIRSLLGMCSLYLFDEGAKPKNVPQRIILVHTFQLMGEDDSELIDSKQSDQLIVDAAFESIAYHLDRDGTHFSFQGKFPREIRPLLNHYSISEFFCQPDSQKADSNEPLIYASEYQLTAIYEDGSQQSSQGVYEKEGLPACFASFIAKITVLLKHHTSFGIFDF